MTFYYCKDGVDAQFLFKVVVLFTSPILSQLPSPSKSKNKITSRQKILKMVFSTLGPGTYDSLGKERRGNMMTTRDNRFRDKKSDTPGPGAYEVILVAVPI